MPCTELVLLSVLKNLTSFSPCILVLKLQINYMSILKTQFLRYTYHATIKNLHFSNLVESFVTISQYSPT